MESLIEELLEEGDFGFIFVNMELDRFDTCFSKFEMVAGLETISRAVKEKNIPCFSAITSVPEKESKIPVSSERGTLSEIPVKSKYDSKFRSQFIELVEVIPKPIISEFYDVFSSAGLRSELAKTGLDKLLFCGFDSERDILASVIGAVREGFTPVVMSDCVSSVSERVFFEVMNVLSRWAVIGDTRDLVKMWDLW